jgi:hypothetical protein
MNNAQDTQNTNVRTRRYFGYSIKFEPALCVARRSLGPTDSHERVSIFISLYYLLTFSPRNRFFFHGPLLHTHLLLFKKKNAVCMRILFYTSYTYTFICICERVEGKKPVFLEKKKTCHCHTSCERVT